MRRPLLGLLSGKRHGIPRHGISGRHAAAPEGCAGGPNPGTAAAPVPAAPAARPERAAPRWDHPPRHQPRQHHVDAGWDAEASGFRLRPLHGGQRRHACPAQARLCAGGAVPDARAGAMDRSVRPVSHHLLQHYRKDSALRAGPARGWQPDPAVGTGRAGDAGTGAGPAVGHGRPAERAPADHRRLCPAALQRAGSPAGRSDPEPASCSRPGAGTEAEEENRRDHRRRCRVCGGRGAGSGTHARRR